jgi:hypothetical protein
MTTYPLRYVCVYCGTTVGEFPDQAASEPAVMSVCEKPECRAKANAKYKATA